MTVIATRQDRRIRELGAGASLVAAAIYALIGLGVLSVGTTTSGASTDLFAFGAIMAAGSVAIAAAMLRSTSRDVPIAIAVLEILVIVGYFAVAGVRVPPVELWGLLVKALQGVVLAAAVVLALHARRAIAR
jgi:hypothetical protein